MRRIAYLVITIIFVLSCVTFAQQTKYVKPESENIRTQPNGDKLGVLLKNVPVKLIEEKGSWSKVQIEAWIYTPSLQNNISSYSNHRIIVNVKQISGKSEAEVSVLLGYPKSSEVTKYGKKCYYNMGLTEIVFINGKADWITTNNMSNSSFGKSSLSKLGLPVKSPSAFLA